ncbi:hypothetical protein HA520_05815 [Azotobacter chroococcum]|uniref:SIR2-like domain-containing protein n=1 Tax=Azotobacter chroococcum TaxID=353 RepID=A0AA44C5U2_9GAMM|nr:SIR2 family protein [Azotobacter chroococcum]NHN76805.1 hypothetical protein [Azotobacter chroococcum]
MDHDSIADHCQIEAMRVAATVASGKAVAFLGAGFSLGCKSVKNIDVPSAKELSKQISKLGKFSEDEDLRYTSDKYLENNPPSELIKFLKDTFTIKETCNHHEKIASANWRRCYTTNYDEVFEIASLKIGRRVESLDINSLPSQHYQKNNLCIHLNGHIKKLNEETINSSFKLSESSYVSPDSFLNSEWHYHFKTDIETCSALVFIGYSMYDMEIQKLLFDNESLKAKTYFITSTAPHEKEIHTLKKYGSIIPIGAEAFSELIGNAISQYQDQTSESDRILEGLELYELARPDIAIADRDVENLLVFGAIEQQSIDASITSDAEIPFLVKRNDLETVLRFLENNLNTVICSGFGNGKTIFLKSLLPYLHTRSFDVYQIVDSGADLIGDIDQIISNTQKSVLLIDNYEHHVELVKHIGRINPDNLKLVITSRLHYHSRIKPELLSSGLTFQEIFIDHLTPGEIEDFVPVITNIGAWGERAALSHQKKCEFLKYENDSQISLALLELFKSKHIVASLKSVMEFCDKNAKYRDTVFAASLINVLNQQVTSSLVSEVAFNDEIYSAKLLCEPGFKQLFKKNGNNIKPKSSLFSFFLLKNSFQPSYIVQQLLSVAKKYGAKDGNVYEEQEIFKSLLRFSFIERILPDTTKKANIRKYYEQLKIQVKWLQHDPHYWLQYAMSVMPEKEYPKAQQFLDQAYSLAKSRSNYHTNHLDTQQGRLYLIQAIQSVDPAKSFEYFKLAHALFCKTSNDIYRYRQVDDYAKYYTAHYNRLSNKNKAYFEQACKKMLADVQKLITSNAPTFQNHSPISRAKENLQKTVEEIIFSRAS